MQTEKGGVIGMRKEALEVRKNYEPYLCRPLPTLYYTFYHPLPTLFIPYFWKRMWYKETVRKRQAQG